MNNTDKLDDIRRRLRRIETRLGKIQRVSVIVFERVTGRASRQAGSFTTTSGRFWVTPKRCATTRSGANWPRNTLPPGGQVCRVTSVMNDNPRYERPPKISNRDLIYSYVFARAFIGVSCDLWLTAQLAYWLLLASRARRRLGRPESASRVSLAARALRSAQGRSERLRFRVRFRRPDRRSARVHDPTCNGRTPLRPRGSPGRPGAYFPPWGCRCPSSSGLREGPDCHLPAVMPG
jgi:hypothetical protein